MYSETMSGLLQNYKITSKRYITNIFMPLLHSHILNFNVIYYVPNGGCYWSCDFNMISLVKNCITN